MAKKTFDYKKWTILIIIIGVVIRFAFALAHNVSGDACWHLSSARFIATHNRIPLFEGLGRLQPFWPPPAFHFAAAFAYKIFSLISLDTANAGMKLVSPVFGTLTAVIAYLIARKLFDERMAFYSTIFLNFVPLFLDYSVLSYTDSATAFFSILSVYFLLDKRYVLSSASFGAAMLSKYNAIFMFPMLIYLAYKGSSNIRERYANLLVVVFLPLLISSAWFIRNFVLLGNPIWPFLNGIFHGVDIGISFNSISFNKIFSFAPYLSSYLELFGVPNGNISLLFLYNVPFMKYLLFIWATSTLIFIYPFATGLVLHKNGNEEKKYFLTSIYILFLSHLFMLFIYLANTGWFGARLLLPIVPFMGIIWAKGMNSIKINRAYLFIILVICAGFILAEGVKISIAAREWEAYSQDFEWVKNNSNEKDIFYGNGQCLSYNINRLVVDHEAPLDIDKIGYAWVNDKWLIDFQMNDVSVQKVKGSNKLKAVYNNTNTGTIIYKVKQ